MSRNLEIVRACFDAYARGDFSYGLDHDLLDREIEYSEMREAPDAATYRGLERLEEGFRAFLRTWEDYRCAADELIDAGDRVVVCARQWGTGKASGATTESVFFQVWTLRDGRVLRIQTFLTREEAVAAAGLGD